MASATGDQRMLADYWRQSVEEFGDAPAVRDDHTVMSFAAFDLLQSSIGAVVVNRVPVGGVVGIVVPKTVWSFAAMIGVANVGRCALLLDPEEPAERWREHCARVDAGVVLAEAADAVARAQAAGLTVIRPDDVELLGAPAPGVEIDPDGDAWIICTSGSTGVPKLVAISQQMLAEAWVRAVERNALWGDLGAAVPVLPPLSSAAIRMAILQAMSGGACAVLVDTARTPPDRMLEQFEALDVRRVFLGPWLLRALLDAAAARGRGVPELTYVISTGAALTVDDVARTWRWFPRARVRSHYGSTEASGIANTDLGPGTDLSEPNVMAATIATLTRIRIVADGVDCAPGEAGEILVWSEGEKGRYRDAPDLVESSVAKDGDGKSWIKTGDLGRLLPDGRLVIEGRDDARVKVNGLAVDLNAVTAAVLALDGVGDAEVSAVPRGDESQLVAWVVAEGGAFLSVRDLRAGLARTLPRPMFPHVFRAISEIPRLPNGKVDRMALRTAAAAEVPVGADHVEPSTPNERALAGLFGANLDRTDVGIYESFFELGGDSLAALELITAVVDRFAVPDARRPALESALMTVGTVSALAAVIETTEPVLTGVEEATLRPDGVGVLVLGNGPPDGVPVVLLPGGGQDPLSFRPLVRRLDGCRVWTLTPRGFRSRVRADRSMDRMAARYADALLALDPRGEFVIAGFSFGGMAAFQLAAELAARGGRVPLLAILDAPAPDVAAGNRGGPKEPALRRWRRIPHAVVWRTRWRYLGVTAGLVRRQGWVQGEAFLSRAGLLIRHFRPRAYAGHTVIVRSAQSARDGFPEDMGWARYLTGEVMALDVRGNHFGVLLEPSVAEIGELLSSAAVTSG